MISVDGLVHEYEAGKRALDGVSFSVEAGEIFGLLGPNGSGKSTLFKIACTLMLPTAGSVSIAGCTAVSEIRRRIGVVFQSPSLDPKLTVAENLKHQARLYGVAPSDALLERFGLTDRAHERTENLSGGLRRRAELAKGLLHGPDVLLLDEPSTGLDPGARIDFWRTLKEMGKTCLLTTHLMEEAERCDRLAILDRGRIVALGTPEELKASVGGAVLTVDGERREVDDGPAALARAAREGAKSISYALPTLEDVFLKATGREFEA